MKKIFVYIFAVVMLLSCTREPEPGVKSFVVSARCVQTKSTLKSDLSVSWNKGDRIAVLSLDGTASAVSEHSREESPVGDFYIREWPSGAEPCYAVFNGTSGEASASIKGRYIWANVNASQKISDKASFASDANLSVGKLSLSQAGEYQTQMDNVCGYLRFSFSKYSDIRKITIQDAESKSLAGIVEILFNTEDEPYISTVAEGKKTVTVLSVSNFGFSKDQPYYVCIIPGTYRLKIIMTRAGGERIMLQSKSSITVEKNISVDVGAIDQEANHFFDSTVSNENFTDGGKADDIWNDRLIDGYHPRMLFSSNEFERLKSRVGGDDILGKLNAHLMRAADVAAAKTSRFTSHLYDDGTYVSRDAAVRLISCAYAYRMTGQKKYLDRAVQDLDDVCSFNTWGQESFLDIAEMAAAVSITYDWLYYSISESLRSKVVQALKVNALDQSRNTNNDLWWYNSSGNWNQVCNSGLVCAAVAVYEYYPELAQEVIDDAIRTNKASVEGIYGPDGAYPEGPTYWSYGSYFQVLMLTVLEDVFGTDYGISAAAGFLNTGLFKVFARGPKNMQFNYADNTVSATSAYSLYYFAFKRNEPALLYNEIKLLDEASYRSSGHKCYLTLALKYALKMDFDSFAQPSQKFYSAQGKIPMMMCRSGWDDDDSYLGVKGGRDDHLHGHMDGGMFVYYSDGVRWALDLEHESYDNLRPTIHAMGGKLFDMTQNSFRWRIFRYNCRQHNSLTVNDKNHKISAYVSMTATENTPERMSATFDLTPLFDGDLAKAERRAALCNGRNLEIMDVLKAPTGKSAHVRWTMMTGAKPEIKSDGILLSAEGVSRKLKVQGGNVTYRIWSSDLDDYDYIIRKDDGTSLETPIDADIYICGYEIDLQPGQELTLTTTLK